MNAGIVFGVITLVLMLLFVGVVVWAWDARRKRGFERAARLALEEDANTDPRGTKPS
jgi:cytochrome c oxidase cbb3-type subunit 4